MLSSGHSLNREELLAELRRALRRGVPRWLSSAVAGCIEELERLAASPGSPDELAKLSAQAETLLALCGRRAASSA